MIVASDRILSWQRNLEGKFCCEDEINLDPLREVLFIKHELRPWLYYELGFADFKPLLLK
jgi:hypothetical protein